MEVRIEIVPKMVTSIDFAKQVKDITKELIETCTKFGVNELTYSHDWFKIQIFRHREIVQLSDKRILDLVQGEE